MKRITLQDYARLSKKITNNPCCVVKGDLVRIMCEEEEYVDEYDYERINNEIWVERLDLYLERKRNEQVGDDPQED